MGVSWEDEKRYAHAILVVPDGRIVCQRPSHPIMAKMWNATVFIKIPKYFAGTEGGAIRAAATTLWATFLLGLPSSSYTHMISHYVQEMARRVELVLCKMPSRSRLVVHKEREIILLPFEGLVKKINEDRGSFGPHTIHAVNILDTMVWG